jgi:metallophosphoesterase superfamily enzyme
MNKEQLKDLFRARRGYLKCGPTRLSEDLKAPIGIIIEAQNEVKKELKDLSGGLHGVNQISKSTFRPQERNKKLTEEDALKFIKLLEDKGYKIVANTHTETTEKTLRELPKPFTRGDKKNVLVIGDIHEPFCLSGYLEFCREQQEMFNCGTVVFIGDIIDNHYASFHDSENDTYGPNEEFQRAKDKIAEWYSVFPVAYVTIGNHDRMIQRKSKVTGIADQWIKTYSEALNTPGWDFVMEVTLDNVCYNHGEGGTASSRMKTELTSQVQGHLHSQAYVSYNVGKHHKVFGMQVGCGIDRESFAFAYGKNGPKPVISCGVVLNSGTLPIVVPMNL